MAERYVPAAGRPAFTRLYDTVVALTMREATFRGRLRRVERRSYPLVTGEDRRSTRSRGGAKRALNVNA